MKIVMQANVKIGYLIALSFSLILFAGCESKKAKESKSSAPIEVSTVIVKSQDLPVNFEFIAQAQSSHLVNVQARVAGFLDRQIYTEGELVKKGQVLFEMDKKPFQTQVDAAKAASLKSKAALDVAKRNFERVKPLAEQNALSQKDLDDATGAYYSSQANVDQAQAQLDTALLNLSYCTITSPIDGITSQALQQEGSYLNTSNSHLTTVSALTPIWINFSLSENELQKYRNQLAEDSLKRPAEGQYQVKILQVNGEIYPHIGKIIFSEPYFSPETGTFLIRSSFDNPKGMIRPNQYVRIRVEGATRPNAIIVPQRAVLVSAKGRYVWVVNNKRLAENRPVTVGDWYGADWFITSGLEDGDEVVVDGVLSLHSGMPVTVKRENQQQ